MASEGALSGNDRWWLAVAIAAVFHGIGLVGMVFFPEIDMVRLTPVNFLVSLALLLWVRRDAALLLSGLLLFAIGFGSEVVGVNTGWLFGDYGYGDTLGMEWLEVPLLIGVNWWLVVLGAHYWAAVLFRSPLSGRGRIFMVSATGATLATAFDFLMEPVAVHLGYWSWADGIIPLYNYACWWVVGFVMMLIVIRFLPFRKEDAYPGYLLLIQSVFFLSLRVLLVEF